MNVLFLLIMTKEMREAGACEGASTGFMSMYKVCIREVDKNPTGQITPESGELTATLNPRPTHLYIPNPKQADLRR